MRNGRSSNQRCTVTLLMIIFKDGLDGIGIRTHANGPVIGFFTAGQGRGSGSRIGDFMRRGRSAT